MANNIKRRVRVRHNLERSMQQGILKGRINKLNVGSMITGAMVGNGFIPKYVIKGNPENPREIINTLKKELYNNNN